MENNTPEQIPIEATSQEEENKEPILDEQKDESKDEKESCRRKRHCRRHNDSSNEEDECFDVPPPFWGRRHHGRFGRPPCERRCRKGERKNFNEEEEKSGNDEEKEALNKQIRETKKQLKALLIQKLQKQFPDFPPRKLNKIAKRIMFHKLCKFGGFGPQCRQQRRPFGVPPPPSGPQFRGEPRPWGPPQQGPYGFPVCERPKRRHPERRHGHCHGRRECERPPCGSPPFGPFGACERPSPPCGPWRRQFGGPCKQPPCHGPFSRRCERSPHHEPSPPFAHFGGPCQRPPPHCDQWGRQFPGASFPHFGGPCEKPPFGQPQFGPFDGRGERPPCHGPPFVPGRRHEMKRLRRWRKRMSRCGMPPPPFGRQWGRPEMRHWKR